MWIRYDVYTCALLVIESFFQGGATLAYEAMNKPHGLIIGTGDTWRTGRHVLTPSFSAMKMKLVEISNHECTLLAAICNKLYT